jgi:hypothetical protein
MKLVMAPIDLRQVQMRDGFSDNSSTEFHDYLPRGVRPHASYKFTDNSLSCVRISRATTVP